MLVEQYISELSDEDKILIMEGYEQFTKDGFIGDEPIRQHANKLIEKFNFDNDSSIIHWMNQLAFDCFRYFTWKSIKK